MAIFRTDWLVEFETAGKRIHAVVYEYPERQENRGRHIFTSEHDFRNKAKARQWYSTFQDDHPTARMCSLPCNHLGLIN